jgi:hypothetical protein
MKKIIFSMAIITVALLASVNLWAQLPPPVEPVDGLDADNIREISSLANLVWLRANYNSVRTESFEFTNDIDFNGNTFTTIGASDNVGYTATIYGNNHTITGLYIITSGTYTGLFGKLYSTGSIKDLKLVSCNITYGVSNGYIGSLLGQNDGLIDNCSATGTISMPSGRTNIGGLVGYNIGRIINSHFEGSVTGGDNCSKIGGLVGYNYTANDITISQCYFNGTVTCGLYCSSVGGLVGKFEQQAGNPSIIKCFSTGSITCSVQCHNLGGLIGYTYGQTTISNCFSTSSVGYSLYDPDYIGGLIGRADGNYLSISKCYSSGAVLSTEIISAGGLIGSCNYPAGVVGCLWDVTSSGRTDRRPDPEYGVGWNTTSMKNKNTYDDADWDLYDMWDIEPLENNGYPYLIFTQLNESIQPFDTDNDNSINVRKLAHLRWISENPLSWSSSYELDKDINVGFTKKWNDGRGFSPIGNDITNFTGHFDGNGKFMDSLFINRQIEDYIGFFGYISGTTTINNLALTTCDISGRYYVGGVTGYLYCSGGVYIDGISHCRTTGEITGSDYVGGLIGKNYLDAPPIINMYLVESCSFCSVTGSNYVGGLIGDNQGRINNCYSRGNVTGIAPDTYIAGAVGNNTGTVDKCFSTGTVTATSDYASLIGGGNPLNTTNSFWDAWQSGKPSSYGGSGQTTVDMKDIPLYVNAGWDLTYIWEINSENSGYPSFIDVPTYKRNIENKEFNITTKNINVDVYPNPVSAETKLIINLDVDLYANIHIYNTLGQKVKSCYSGEIAKGTKEINLDLQDLNEGSYYLIIENNSVLSCKMIVISR